MAGALARCHRRRARTDRRLVPLLGVTLLRHTSWLLEGLGRSTVLHTPRTRTRVVTRRSWVGVTHANPRTSESDAAAMDRVQTDKERGARGWRMHTLSTENTGLLTRTIIKRPWIHMHVAHRGASASRTACERLPLRGASDRPHPRPHRAPARSWDPTSRAQTDRSTGREGGGPCVTSPPLPVRSLS